MKNDRLKKRKKKNGLNHSNEHEKTTLFFLERMIFGTNFVLNNIFMNGFREPTFYKTIVFFTK